MTEKDKQELAEVINNALAAHQCNCPLGFDEDAARVLNNFAKALQQGQKTALKAIVTLTIGAIVYAFYEGVKLFLNK